MIQELLHDAALRWQLDGLTKELTALEADPTVAVGFLGDFSSGKSTLINDFVDIDELTPTMLEPCTATASLVVAVPGQEEPAFFRNRTDGTLVPVKRAVYDDMARGLTPGRPVAHVAPSDGFPDGFVLADTPGLSSLTEGHEQVTMGELPFFDAAVICIDIQKGGLSNSVINFLTAPAVRHLKQRFILALTHADKRTNTQAEKVRNKTAVGLARVLGISESDADERIIVVASGPDSGERRNIEPLRTKMHQLIADRRQALAAERKERASKRLVPHAICLLEQHKAVLQETDSEVVARRAKLEEQVKAQKGERAKQRRRLDAFQQQLRRDVQAVCERHRPLLAAAKDETSVSAASNSLTSELASAVASNVGKFGDDVKTDFSGKGGELLHHLSFINRSADLSKTIATAAITAWLLPGAGAVKTAAEAGGGAVARKVSAEGAKRAAAKAAAEGTAKEVAKKGFFKSFALSVLKTIDDINPVNYVGDLVAEQIKAQTLEAHLDDVASAVSTDASKQLEALYEHEYFSVIDQRLSDLRNKLEAADIERRQDLVQRQVKIAELTADIMSLSATVET